MPLPIIRGFYFLSVHLLFASCVCLVAWLLTSRRGGSASTKHFNPANRVVTAAMHRI